jgi:type III secretion system FlhB-like substrate exporter
MDKAVALKYLPELSAPFIIAKGKGELAEKIKALAAGHDVAIVVNEPLADKLIAIDVGGFIPEELYAIIAEILVFTGRFGS